LEKEGGIFKVNIHIVTFHRALNYGAVLQAYALYRSVAKLAPAGSGVFILDHKNSHIDQLYSVLPSGTNLRALPAASVSLPAKAVKKARFKKFLEGQTVLSREDNAEGIFIAGSDQVWNLRCTGGDRAYFLDFVKDNDKKNAYAASFGAGDVEPRYAAEIGELLSGFRNISVREQEGRRIVEALTGREAPVVLDPTLLLDAGEWGRVASKSKFKGAYVLLYTMTITPSIARFAAALAREKGLPLLHITDSVKWVVPGSILKNHAGPQEWLRLFLDAETVVTNSFHGTAAAVNFNKPFFTELLPEPSKVNGRLIHLLELFGLRGRLIEGGAPSPADTPIDYTAVNIILSREREFSLEYLRGVVGG